MVRVWLVLALMALSSGCPVTQCGKGIELSGVTKTDAKDLPNFTSVEFAGVGEAEIKIGAKSSIEMTGDTNVLARIHTDVTSGRLVIKQDSGFTVFGSQGPHFVITTPKLEAIKQSGAMSVKALSLATDHLNIDQSGAGKIELSGKVRDLTLSLSGAGDIEANALNADNVTANVSGFGNISVHANVLLKADISGAGSIEYSGSAKVEKSISGVGSIHQK